MSFIDRTMCRMLQKSVAKKPVKTLQAWERALLAAVGQTCDWTDKKYLVPLLDFVKQAAQNDR